MAITFIQEDKKKKYALGALALVGTVAVLYGGLKYIQTQEPLELPVLGSRFLQERDIRIDFAVLSDPRLMELRVPQTSILVPDIFGKDNPFSI
jgi:hypothetical protein